MAKKRLIAIIGLILAVSIVITACDPMAIRQIVEEIVLGKEETPAEEEPNMAPTADAGTYTAYEPNGLALKGSGADEDEDTLTYKWEEISTHGVAFDDSTRPDPTLTYDGWDDGEAVVEIELKLTVSDGVDDATDPVTIKLYNTNFAYVNTTGGGDGQILARK